MPPRRSHQPTNPPKTEQKPTNFLDGSPIIIHTVRMDAILNPIEPALISAVAKAIATLTAILDDAAAPAAHKIRAACTILRISMSWPKQREAVASASRQSETNGIPIPPSPSPPTRQHHPGSSLPAVPNPPIPSLAARLDSLSTRISTPPLPTSRATTLLASAGAAPLISNHSPLTRLSSVFLPLAKTG